MKLIVNGKIKIVEELHEEYNIRVNTDHFQSNIGIRNLEHTKWKINWNNIGVWIILILRLRKPLLHITSNSNHSRINQVLDYLKTTVYETKILYDTQVQLHIKCESCNWPFWIRIREKRDNLDFPIVMKAPGNMHTSLLSKNGE